MIIDINDISKGSDAVITYICDYCGSECKGTYKQKIKERKIINKDCCASCSVAKIYEINRENFKLYVEKNYDHSDSPFKKIPLSKNKFTVVDSKNYDWLMNMCRWHCTWDGYAQTKILLENGKRKNIRMHRLIMGLPSSEFDVDHKNGDRLLNTEENLRICTSSENSRNRESQKDSSSQFKGVVLTHTAKGEVRWGAYVYLNKLYRIGSFTSEIAAANAYNLFAKYLYGEFARLNNCPFMPEEEWRSYCLSRKQLYPSDII